MIAATFLDRVPYGEALALQRSLRGRVQRGGGAEFVLLLEHPKVLTIGYSKRGREGLLASAEALAGEGIEVVEVDRGGEWTYHGPGQLVAYFVLDLKPRKLAIKQFVHLLEEAMIRLLDDYGLPARCYPGKPGAWIDRRKIGFIGLNAQGGVTTHGLALNVTGDLAPFAHIVPCGLEGCEVTSIRALTGRDVSVRDAAQRFAPVLEEFLGEPLVTWQPEAIRAWAAEDAA